MPRHFCAVISDAPPQADGKRLSLELAHLLGRRSLLPCHMRIVHERRATVLVRPSVAAALPPSVLDAGEQPRPGQLPATIETAVMRGRQAADALLSTLS